MKTLYSDDIDRLTQDLRRKLNNLYGQRLKGLYLFGSHVRGEATEESDLDILLVLDDFLHYGIEIDRTGELIASLSLTYGISISRVFLRQRDWLTADTPFLSSVRREAVAA